MNFSPGTTIKAYCWQAEDVEWLNISITSDTRVMKTMIKNPLSKAKVIMQTVLDGETTALGKFLIKGSKNDVVTSGQSLKDGEFGLYIEIKP